MNTKYFPLHNHSFHLYSVAIIVQGMHSWPDGSLANPIILASSFPSLQQVADLMVITAVSVLSFMGLTTLIREHQDPHMIIQCVKVYLSICHIWATLQ